MDIQLFCMLLQGTSQIVKSDQRECHQWSGYKSFSSCFRRGLWEAELYDASLQVVTRDEFLDAGQTFVELNKSGENTWLTPLVGAIAVLDLKYAGDKPAKAKNKRGINYPSLYRRQ